MELRFRFRGREYKGNATCAVGLALGVEYDEGASRIIVVREQAVDTREFDRIFAALNTEVFYDEDGDVI